MLPGELLNLAKRLKSIADIGLLYCNSEYDRERYHEIEQVSFELMRQLTGAEIPDLKQLFLLNKDYPTVKVDIRALIIKDGAVLLVKESMDRKWSLPGGWADIGYSPKEVLVKECKEETGLEVMPEKLLAIFDKRFHPHPPQPSYVYKMVFSCKAVSEKINKGFDILDVQYFDINRLPELSEDRILSSQLALVYEKLMNNDQSVYFD